MAQSRWQYVFCNALTGVEIATLPMYGVSFEQKLCDVGQLTGTIPTTDPDVRALDPWSACEPRKTSVYVEHDGVPVWGGLVLGSQVDQDTYGIKVTAASFEFWLTRQYSDANSYTTGYQLGAPSTFAMWVQGYQQLTNNNIGLTVSSNQYPWTIGQGGDGTGETRVPGRSYWRTDLKSLTELLQGWVTDWGVPIEWRVDVAKGATGYTRTLIVTEIGLAAGRNSLSLLWPTPPTGENGLLTFTDTRDGTVEYNTVLGSAQGASDNTAAGTTPLFSWASPANVGSDEFAGGYLQMAETYSVGGTGIAQATLDNAVRNRLVQDLVQGRTLTNLTLLADAVALASYQVGDNVDVSITHPGYREWPAPTVYTGYRLMGRKVTIGSGTTPDTVSLDLVPPAAQLPRSLSIVAILGELQKRVRQLTTPVPTGGGFVYG